MNTIEPIVAIFVMLIIFPGLPLLIHLCGGDEPNDSNQYPH